MARVFFEELKRRNVFKVGAAYAVVAWLLAQISDVALSAFEAPAIVQQIFLIFLALGFPVAVLLAWAYELTPEGIRPTAEVEPAQSVTQCTGQKLNYLIIALLAAAVVVMFVDNYVPEAGRATSIAVLPFENLSAETGQDAFTDGFVIELHSRLAQIEDLSVTALTSSMAYRDSNMSAPQIAAELGVDYLLEGRMTRNEDSLRVFATLIDAADGRSVWTSPYDRELADPFELQLELAETVAERLSVTFGVGDFDREAGGTTNLKAYDFYLAARDSNLTGGIEAAIALFDRALALDPDFGLAHLHAAYMIIMSLTTQGVTLDDDLTAGDLPQDNRDVQRIVRLQQRGRVALARARALVPDHLLLTLIDADDLVAERRWAEAEAIFRDRLNQTARSDAVGNAQIGRFLYLTGRTRQAIPFLERARELNPRAAGPVAALAMAYDALGELDRAMALDAEARSLRGYGAVERLPQYWRLRAIGEHVAAEQLLEDGGTAIAGSMDLMISAFENRSQIPADSPAIITANVGMLAAVAGDVEFACEMWRRALLGSPQHLLFVWTPLLDEVRRHPDFEMLMSEMGLPGYWQQYGWPEHCQPAEPEGFECD